MSSLALLPPRKFCSFWKTISPWLLHSKNQSLRQLLSFTRSLKFVVNSCLVRCLPCGKSSVNKETCEQWRQQRFPYTFADFQICQTVVFLFSSLYELVSPYLSCRRLLLETQTSWGNIRRVSSVILTAELWSRTRVYEEEKVPVLSNPFSVSIMTKTKVSEKSIYIKTGGILAQYNVLHVHFCISFTFSVLTWKICIFSFCVTAVWLCGLQKQTN